MKRILAIALLALVGCASNKPKNYDRECEAFFVRMDDFQKRFQGTEREKEFAVRYERATKGVFPMELEDGTIVNCHERITCNGADYCIALEVNGKWVGFIF